MRSALVVLVVVVLLPVGSVAVRWAWLSRRRRLVAWWEETLGPVLHPPRTLDVAGLQRRILVVALREVSVTDRGVAVLPAWFRIEVSDDDARRLGPLLRIVEDELADDLGSEAVKRSWLRPERVRVTITAGSAVDGRPRARAVLGPEAVDPNVPGGSAPATTAPGRTAPGTSGLRSGATATTVLATAAPAGPSTTGVTGSPGTGSGTIGSEGAGLEPAWLGRPGLERPELERPGEGAGPRAAEPAASHRTARGAAGADGIDVQASGGDTMGPAATGDPRGLHPAGSGRTVRRRSTVPTAPPPVPAPPSGTSRLVVCELISADGGRDIDLTDRNERLTVGRAGSDVALDDARVSFRHAELVPAAGGQWLLDDTDSLNGTWVNGRRVERASLVHGDEVSFAGSGPRFLFSRLAGAGR